jgi:hypothetical protein
MVFTKPLNELGLEDIKALKDNSIPESDILDYKVDLIDDDKLVKHVSAFANSRGGFIVFGIEETGRGGIPKTIPGVDSSKINKEKMEQILLSNVAPRIHIRFKVIGHETTGKSILVIQVPDSALKPHMNLSNRKYHKRFEFEAPEMGESEVADLYRRRFFTYQEVNDYVQKVLSKENLPCNIASKIIIIPTVIESRILDISARKEFDWLDPNKFDPQPSGFGVIPQNGYLPSPPEPSSNGLLCVRDQNFPWYLELHRNGCIEHMREVGFERTRGSGTVYLDYRLLAAKLLHTLQFADLVYSKYNYFGDVRVIVSIAASTPPLLPTESAAEKRPMNSKHALVQREFPSTMLASDFSYLVSGIMNELFNCFGLWRCPLFEENGTYVKERFIP